MHPKLKVHVASHYQNKEDRHKIKLANILAPLSFIERKKQATCGAMTLTQTVDY